MGMMLAAEPAEPGVMCRPPRRPGKRLLGKLVIWRCVFVCTILVILVLGMFEWCKNTGLNLDQCRAEAFNTLVFGEIGYVVTTRFIKLSTFHLRVFQGNPYCFLSIALTAGLQVFLTYTPGVQWFMNMPDGMASISWARVMVCMIVVYIVVEIEKWLVDPIMMPIIRPAFKFISKLIPNWFKNDKSGSHAVDEQIEEKRRKEAEKEAVKPPGAASEPSDPRKSSIGSHPHVSHTYGQAFARISHTNQRVSITLAD